MANNFSVAGVALDEPGLAHKIADPDFAGRIDEVLKVFVADQVREINDLDAELEPLTRTAAAAVLSSGKRLRPAFAYWGWRAAAGPEAAVTGLLPAFAALELLHAFALVHDDVMDQSAVRRGRPTAHRRLAADHVRGQLKGNSVHFGLSGAILVGDLCLVWADRLMSQADVPASVLLGARSGYDWMRVETIAGQFLDVLGESSWHWSLSRAVRTALLKTARYTVTRPLLFGAALADSGRSPATDSALRRYGNAVGVAFQLRDDLLDVYGDPARTGKPVGEDLRACRPTVLVELARAMANPGQSAKLDRLLAAGQGMDVAEVGRLLEEIGAATRVEKMIERRLLIATAALRRAPIDACAIEPLTRLAHAAAWRRT